jgi:GNAT superfamily N-acetyltransferase
MTEKQIKIRAAVRSDAPILSALIYMNALKTLAEHYSALQMQTFQNYYSTANMELKVENQQLFCACSGSEIVGTVALDGFLVVGFYTHPDYLGQGIGKQLMDFVVHIARTNGVQRLELTASPAATGFYLKHSWQVVKPCVWMYQGVGFDETLMELNVNME